MAGRGKLDQLLQSGARLSETALVPSALRNGDGLPVDGRRIGPSLIFERLWRETGGREPPPLSNVPAAVTVSAK